MISLSPYTTSPNSSKSKQKIFFHSVPPSGHTLSGCLDGYHSMMLTLGSWSCGGEDTPKVRFWNWSELTFTTDMDNPGATRLKVSPGKPVSLSPILSVMYRMLQRRECIRRSLAFTKQYGSFILCTHCLRADK